MSQSVKQFLSSPSDQQGLRVRVRDGHGGHPQADQIYLRQPREGQRVLLHPGGAGHSAAGESLAHAHALARAVTSRGPDLHYRPNASTQFTAERNAPLFLVRHKPVTFCVAVFVLFLSVAQLRSLRQTSRVLHFFILRHYRSPFEVSHANVCCEWRRARSDTWHKSPRRLKS